MGLDISGLSKHFKTQETDETIHVLNDIDCQVKNGQFLSIVGPSGCGKTTFLRIIAGLEEPSSGRIMLDGRAIRHDVDRIGMVFQEYALFPWRRPSRTLNWALK